MGTSFRKESQIIQILPDNKTYRQRDFMQRHLDETHKVIIQVHRFLRLVMEMDVTSMLTSTCDTAKACDKSKEKLVFFVTKSFLVRL